MTEKSTAKRTSAAKRTTKSAATKSTSKSVAKRTSAAKPAKSAAKRAPREGMPIFETFESAKHETFLCPHCGIERSVRAFPPIKSNDPSVRKNECRTCRSVRNGKLRWVETSEGWITEPVTSES